MRFLFLCRCIIMTNSIAIEFIWARLVDDDMRQHHHARHFRNRILGDATTSSNIVTIEGSETPMFFCNDDVCRTKVMTQQNDIVSKLQALHPAARLVAQVQKLANVVFVDLGTTTSTRTSYKIKNIAGIKRIQKHQTYTTLLNRTVEYIQGNQAHETFCTTGKGVKIAILDDGIDYTHEAIGGSGTIQAYQQAYGRYDGSERNARRDGFFPTKTVYEGIDFLGDLFRTTKGLQPQVDNDPINQPHGHGTFVASNILAVAPDAKLLLARVCSSMGYCPEFAVLQGMEFAMDPNGDGDFADKVDFINLSLGLPAIPSYYDMVSYTIEQAFKLGTLTVVSFGNTGNVPFLAGPQASSPNALAVGATMHPDFWDQVDGHQYVEWYSTRGPGSQFQLKPDISAPSGSFAAVAGTGNQYARAFGTSFSAPITTGAAALVKERCFTCSPFAIKAILMNNVETNIGDQTTMNITIKKAPLSSVGNGELRIGTSLDADFWAFSPDEGDVQPSISLGLFNVAGDILVLRRIRIVSLTNATETIKISVNFRDPSDAALGALEVNIPQSNVTLSSCSADTEILVQFKIVATNVPNNFLESASSPESLDNNEFDGHIVLVSTKTFKSIRIPFYTILRKASNVTVTPNALPNGSTPFQANISVENTGAGVAQIDVYQLLGRTKDDPEAEYGTPELPSDIRAIGYRTIHASYSNCSYVVEFVFNLWERPRRIIPFYPFIAFVNASTNETISFLISRESTHFEFEVVVVNKLDGSQPACTGFSLINSPGSANIVMRGCGEQLGLKENQNLSVKFGVRDISKIGGDDLLELLGPLKIEYPHPAISAHSYDIRPGATLDNLEVTNRNNNNISQPMGILLVTNAYRSTNSTGASVKEQEGILLLRNGLSNYKEITVDKLLYPQANDTGGPQCLWRSEMCLFPTLAPTLYPAPSSTETPTKSPTAILTEFPSATSEPSIPTYTYSPTFAPDCPPHKFMSQSVPTGSPSLSNGPSGVPAYVSPSNSPSSRPTPLSMPPYITASNAPSTPLSLIKSPSSESSYIPSSNSPSAPPSVSPMPSTMPSYIISSNSPSTPQFVSPMPSVMPSYITPSTRPSTPRSFFPSPLSQPSSSSSSSPSTPGLLSPASAKNTPMPFAFPALPGTTDSTSGSATWKGKNIILAIVVSLTVKILVLY